MYKYTFNVTWQGEPHFRDLKIVAYQSDYEMALACAFQMIPFAHENAGMELVQVEPTKTYPQYVEPE